jgi:hypothetical protein
MVDASQISGAHLQRGPPAVLSVGVGEVDASIALTNCTVERMSVA